MRKTFSNINIGDKFNLGTYSAIYPYNEPQCLIYIKVDKSTAKCIDQQGYGNKRHVGSTAKLSTNKIVYVITQSSNQLTTV